jgi:hypothetical protein
MLLFRFRKDFGHGVDVVGTTARGFMAASPD